MTFLIPDSNMQILSNGLLNFLYLLYHHFPLISTNVAKLYVVKRERILIASNTINSNSGYCW